MSSIYCEATTKAVRRLTSTGLGGSGEEFGNWSVIDGAYLPHAHRKINSEFYIIAGRGHSFAGRRMERLSRRSQGRRSAWRWRYGFITDPEFGPTVFLSIQSDPIRRILIDRDTQTESFEDDFVYVDDVFPLPADLLDARNRTLAALNRR